MIDEVGETVGCIRPHAQPASRRARAIARGWSRPSAVHSGSRLRPRRRPPRRPTSSCARQSPRSGTVSVSPRGSGERASSHHSGSRAIVVPPKINDAQLFGQSRTLRVKQLLGLDCSMANLDLAAPSPASPFCPIPTIFMPFRGPPGPAPTSCGNRPCLPAN